MKVSNTNRTQILNSHTAAPKQPDSSKKSVELAAPKAKTNHKSLARLARESQAAANKHLAKMHWPLPIPVNPGTGPVIPDHPPKPKPKPTPGTNGKGQMYVDWSMMGSKLENSPFINWYNPKTGKAEYQWDKIDTYLNSLFKSMHDGGMNQMDIAFAQLSDINSWNEGKASMNGTGAYDSISQLLSIMNQNEPGAGNEMLKHIAADAKANGVSLDLSFGGEAANGDCMALDSQSGKWLASFCKEYGIGSVDLDLEGIGTSSFLANGKEKCNDFLRDLQQNGIKTTLTTTASVPDNQELLNTLDPDVKNGMSGYNIMAYSASEYYCSANNPTWGAEKWIDALGKQNAGKLNWGFYDAVNYKTPQDGNISNGQAAAKRFDEMNAQLKKDGYPTLTGSPFFWPDVGDKYDPVNGKCELINPFETDFMHNK